LAELLLLLFVGVAVVARSEERKKEVKSKKMSRGCKNKSQD